MEICYRKRAATRNLFTMKMFGCGDFDMCGEKDEDGLANDVLGIAIPQLAL
jgi:hypothetical protein